jgi:tetratricopeptide (TPR) repeat protein
MCVKEVEMSQPPRPLFGKLLTEAISSVARRKRVNMEVVEEDLAFAISQNEKRETPLTFYTVQRWMRGFPQDSRRMKVIVDYCVRQGHVPRDLAEGLLRQADCENLLPMLDELYGRRAEATQVSIYSNLPPRSGEFLGRQQEMTQIIEGLTSRWPIISIEGMGGIGKTTLAIEVARACLPDGAAHLDYPFEACVFISAKDRVVVLDDLLDAVARVLNYPYIVQKTAPSEKPAEVDRLLRARHVLIIADNFETVTDMALVDYLQRIPEPSKVLITTRYGQLRRVWDVPLKGLPDDEALELIRLHGKRLRLPAVAQSEDKALRPLVAVTGGNPYALETALGYLKYSGMALNGLVNALYTVGREVSEIFDYIFGSAWDLLSQNARQLLMVMSLFVESANKPALGAAAGVEGYYLDTAVGQLVEMSLLNANGTLEESQQRYSVHPLTLAFASAKLRDQQMWEKEARTRWLQYWFNFAKTYAGRDWDEELSHYSKLRSEASNLLEVMDWLADTDQFADLSQFFCDIQSFLYAEGYWQPLLNFANQIATWAMSVADADALASIVRSPINIYRQQMTLAEGQAWLDRLQAAALQIADELLQAEIWLGRGRLLYVQGAVIDGSGFLTNALEIFRRHAKAENVVQTLNALGNLHLRERQFDEAVRCYEEGLRVLDNNDQTDYWLYSTARWRSVLRGNLAIVAGRQGHYAEACTVLHEILKDMIDKTDRVEVYVVLALYELRLGHEEKAWELRAQADQLIEQLGLRHPYHDVPEDLEWMRLHGELDEEGSLPETAPN